MIILQIQNTPLECDACLSFLALGGIVALAAGLGYLICTFLDRDPKGDLGSNLITNVKALELIANYQAPGYTNTASGHLELGVLLAYIDKVKTQCSSINKELSGLEYYFAKYGEFDNPPNENQNTIVIYPTYKNGNDHIPIDPFLPLVNNEPVTVKSINIQYKIDVAAQASMSDSLYTSNNVLNKSHMSPPRQPTL